MLNVITGYLGDKAGYFIDIGAMDGVTESNSVELFNNGWSGVAVEPDPESYAKLKKHYPSGGRVETINKAISLTDGDIEFHSANKKPKQISSAYPPWVELTKKKHGVGFYNNIKVISLTIPALWESIGRPVVDVLFIDTEGFDADIIESMDLVNFRPSLIVAETCHFDNKERISTYLRKHGYILKKEWPRDDMWMEGRK